MNILADGMSNNIIFANYKEMVDYLSLFSV